MFKTLAEILPEHSAVLTPREEWGEADLSNIDIDANKVAREARVEYYIDSDEFEEIAASGDFISACVDALINRTDELGRWFPVFNPSRRDAIIRECRLRADTYPGYIPSPLRGRY